MHIRTYIRKGAVALVAAAALAMGTASAQDKPVELTFSVWIPANHPLVKDFMMPWAKQVEEATQSRVKIRFLPKPVTNPVGHYDAVRNGLVDLAFISNSYYPGRLDLMKFAMLPFSGNSAEATSVAVWRTYDKYLRPVDLYRGVKLLGLYGHGPGAVFTTGRKIEKVEDFNGLRLRIGGGMQADVAKALGVNAIVKPAPESYELMSTGVVDGVFFPPESISSFRLVSLVKQATLFPGGLYADVHSIIMNPKAFDKLSPADQQALLKLSGEHIARMGGEAWGAADTAALKDMKEAHTDIHVADAELVSGVKARTAPIQAEWLAAAKSRHVDGPQVLDYFHSQLKTLENAPQED
ncbi:MAG TPA: TRAP transporter substrate-binding protein [Nevskiaceae bacterium]